MELIAVLAIIVFLFAIMVLLIWEANTLRRPHAHHGPERSRHERNGKLVVVHQCRRCGLHFSVEED